VKAIAENIQAPVHNHRAMERPANSAPEDVQSAPFSPEFQCSQSVVSTADTMQQQREKYPLFVVSFPQVNGIFFADNSHQKE
jgi:hypothetical protein